MDLVVSAVLPVFALIGCGWAAARLGVLGPETTAALNRFVVTLALPALLFQLVATQREGLAGGWRFAAVFGGGMAATFLLSLAFDRGSPLADRAIEGLDAAYANTGFLGIPLALGVFGPAAAGPAVLSALLTVCGIFAVAILLIEADTNASSTPAKLAWKVGGSLLRNPLLVTPVLGAAWAAGGAPLPAGIARFISLLSAAASPCALVTIGLFLARPETGARAPTVARLVLLKLAAQPVLTAALALLMLPLPPGQLAVAVLLSALPTGTGPFMLATAYRRPAASTSQAIFFSTVLSVVTLSLLVAVAARP